MKFTPPLFVRLSIAFIFASLGLQAQIHYTNDWNHISPSVVPPADVYSITIGNEFVLIPVDKVEDAQLMTGSVFYSYIVNSANYRQRQVVRLAEVPSGGEAILGWGANERLTYLVTTQSQTLHVEQLSIASNGSVQIGSVNTTGNKPSSEDLSLCISTQSGKYISFYNPSASIVYLLHLKTLHWTSKAVSGEQPESLPGMTSFGWIGEDGNSYAGYVGGVNPDETASNQGYYLNITQGTATGMRNDASPNGRGLQLHGPGDPTDPSIGTLGGILSFYCGHAAGVVLNNMRFTFGDQPIRQVLILLAGASHIQETGYDVGCLYPTSLLPTTRLRYGDVSLAFTNTSWWANSSRTDLPVPRIGGELQKISINGKATLMYFGGTDQSGAATRTTYRLDLDADYTAPGTLPTFGIGQPATVAYQRTPLHFFSRNDNPSHLFSAVQSEVDNVNATMSEYFSYEGVSHYVVANYTLNSIPVYRMYNRLSGAHFYTANPDEVLTILENMDYFSLEGVAFFVFAGATEAGTLPVYRFYVPQTGSHYFTISEAEKNELVNSGQTIKNYEGIAWYAYPTQ